MYKIEVFFIQIEGVQFLECCIKKLADMPDDILKYVS